MPNKNCILAIVACFSLLTACKKDPTPTLPPAPGAQEIISKYLNLQLDALPNYANPSYPVHYDNNVRSTDNSPSINRVTDAGATLGRVLFYDKKLSINGATACASCHVQAKGFTDDAQFSEGFAGAFTTAHSMRLGNANFYTGEVMFWDKRALDLEDQSTQPIKNHLEMGFDDAHGGLDSLLRRMRQLEYYPILFEQAFGSPNISENAMKLALSQFVRSMVSSDSKFDQGFAQVFNTGQPGAGVGTPFSNFTAAENMGKALFLQPPPQGGAGCAGCHQPPTFTLAANSRNNGLDATGTTIFKAPSLKNVAAAGHYMHDGRLATLADVVEHYNSGIQPSPQLDNRLRGPNGQPLRLNLSQAQKDALVAFLTTLTDNSLNSAEKFASPFK